MKGNWRASRAVLVWAGVLAAVVVAPSASGQDGAIMGWGRWVVVMPSELTGLVAIAVGSSHSLGLKFDGSIAAWGHNWYGECDIPAPNSNFVAR